MPGNSLDDLIAMANSDEELMTALRSAATGEEGIRLADERGVHISLDDLQVDDRELSDSDLEAVSGGTMMRTAIYYACLETLPRFC